MWGLWGNVLILLVVALIIVVIISNSLYPTYIVIHSKFYCVTEAIQ